MRRLLNLMLATVVVACNRSDARYIAIAERTVNAQLTDPYSARFADERVYPLNPGLDDHRYVVCGTVNSKTTAGGYGGVRRFVATTDDTLGLAMFEDQLSPVEFFDLWKQTCRTPDRAPESRY